LPALNGKLIACLFDYLYLIYPAPVTINIDRKANLNLTLMNFSSENLVKHGDNYCDPGASVYTVSSEDQSQRPIAEFIPMM
jgi:hypothetical protein